nr:hypothetical protein [Tanacetum cinerariifolium]
MQNLKDISNPTTALDMVLKFMSKAFQLNNTTLTNNNQRSSSNPSNMQIAQPGMNMDQDRQMLMVEDNIGNQFRPNAMQNVKNQYGNRNVVTAPAEGNGNGINDNPIKCYNYRGMGHLASNFTVKPRKRDATYLQQQLQIAQEEEVGIQSTQEEFKFMAAADAYEETERVKANFILENNLQQASTSGTQSGKASVYDTDGSAEVHLSENCYDNDIFVMYTQEEKYTELLESIPEPHQVPRNDSNVISEVFSVEQGGGTVEQHPANVEETRALYDSLYNNLAIEVEKVNTVNRKLRETNVELTTELARYKIQEKCFEISQEIYDKLERVQNFEIQFLIEAAKFVRDFKSLTKEAEESLAKHKALELEIERLLRAVISQDIMSVVQNPSVKLENKNVELEFQVWNYENENAHLKTTCKTCLRAQLFDKVSEQKDTTKGTSVNTVFCKQSILGKPSSSRSKLYFVTPFPKSSVLPKVDKKNALSKPVTSNSAPSIRELKGVQTVNVIAPRNFRTNASKTFRVDNDFPNKPVKASVRTKPIMVSQSHVITKNDVNSKTNGLSPKDVKSTTRTRRPLPRNNSKNYKVPSKSKSS